MHTHKHKHMHWLTKRGKEETRALLKNWLKIENC